jgi:hypothetical protein
MSIVLIQPLVLARNQANAEAGDAIRNFLKIGSALLK